MNAPAGTFTYRTVFISDLHLGTRGARTDFLIDFLSSMQCFHLFLVGDIVDGWRLRKSWYWDAAHDEVLRLVLRHARSGTQVTYIPGNHDEGLRRWLPLGLEIAGVRMANEATHVTAAGQRLLVTHGDEFDNVVRYAKFLAHLGDNAYTVALAANHVFNAARRRLGYPYWSLSQWLKRQVKGAVAFIDQFEVALAQHARSRGFDGVVCGHIHHAQMREVGGTLYLNDGDWVESCTALVEHADGRLELVDWAARRRLSFHGRRPHAPAMPPPAMTPRRIAIISDAWHPQVNGVVRTLAATAAELQGMGHDVLVVGPDQFRTVPCPTYPEIRLALFPAPRLARMLQEFRPDSLHVATEGPLGLAARAWARRRGTAFTTSLHTRFPDYVHARFGVPAALPWWWLRRFHSAAAATMIATDSLRRELDGRGFRHLRLWPRGVDTAVFRPDPRRDWGLPRPVLLSVGRVAPEKNLPAFLDMDVPGSKVVVGDGPLLPRLRRDYPHVTFTGALSGAALAEAYAGADAFVFPSRTDTFGLVLLESMACGTPVAAYPVPGPQDVVPDTAGALHEDLATATRHALTRDRHACRAHAERRGWSGCARTFLDHLMPLGASTASPVPAGMPRAARNPI